MRLVLLALALAMGAAHAGVTVSRFTVTSTKPRQTSATPQAPKKVMQGNGCPSVRIDGVVDGKPVSLCVQKNRWTHTAGRTRFTATSMSDILFVNGFDTAKPRVRVTK